MVIAHPLGTPSFVVRSADQACYIRCKIWLSTLQTVCIACWDASSKLGQVRLPHIACVFRMRSLLSGAYTRGSKISHTACGIL